MRKNYTSVPIGMLVGYMIGGVVVAVTSAFLDFLFGAGVGIALAFAGLALTYVSKDDLDPELTIYRYEVERCGGPVTVYAADVNTDEVDAGTVHFSDHDGNTIAILNMVATVKGRKVLTEED